MERRISVSNYEYLVEYPEKCPICHHYGDISAELTFELSNNKGVRVVFQCPFLDCQHFFIGYYGQIYDVKLIALKPQEPDMAQFSTNITELSSQFVEIFKQAEHAKALGLDQIAGPGYRKAFEYLVKDHAKSLSPDKSDEIEATFSGSVVKEYIEHPKIQSVAKRALWLGNDEAHYLKKWTDHDINDLITLIKLTTNWIEIEQLSHEYAEEMPD